MHAAGSGVGTAIVQIAHAMGCPVFGTSRTADMLEPPQSSRHGLRASIPSRYNFAEVVLGETKGRGVNVVIDLVGGRGA